MDKVVVVGVAALGAADAEMRPAERFGHAAGRNPVHLHNKDDKDQRAGKGRQQPFKVMVDHVHMFVAAGYQVVFGRLEHGKKKLSRKTRKIAIIDKMARQVKAGIG